MAYHSSDTIYFYYGHSIKDELKIQLENVTFFGHRHLLSSNFEAIYSLSKIIKLIFKCPVN